MWLGLGAELLPIVHDPNAQPTATTKVKHFGKVPSEYEPDGRARGIAGWQSKTTTARELQKWSADRRYSMGVRCRTVRALDVDIDDPERAAEVAAFIAERVQLPKRTRANSPSFLQPFLVEGEYKKATIKTGPGPSDKIEFLAGGQQTVVAGRHKSGVMYEWEGGRPAEIPRLESEQFDALWAALAERFGTEPAKALTIRDGSQPAGDLLTEITDAQLRDLKDALTWPPLLKAAGDEKVCSEVGYRLLTLGELGRELWLGFCANADDDSDEPDPDWPQKWWSAHVSGEVRSDFRGIYKMAQDRGWPNPYAGEPASVDDFDVIEPEPDAPAERPIIQLAPGELHVYAVKCETLLSAELYERDHKLVRIAGAVELTGDTRKMQRNAAQPVILEAGTEYIIRRLGELARFVAIDGRANKPRRKDCPAALARNIVEQKTWPSMRRLTAIASAPFVRPDMTVCTAPGYDDDTGVFYLPNAEFPDMPAAPTKMQGTDALAMLLAPFDQFPFVSEASRAAFASNVLTEAVRLAVDTVPVFTYSAPEAGTGKTLLAEMPARIVHGIEPAKRAWAEGDELRKVLFASLLVGDRSILFDNAKKGGKIRTDVLCNFVTAPLYSDRKLGVSEAPAMPNRAVVSLTGNNITPTGDLARRSIVIRQVAEGDTAALRARRFKIRDLKGYVSAHRGELLTAALTVVRAFVVAGCPEQAVPLPSFEQWSRLARDPLLWLGLADPIETQADETDDEAAPLAGAFVALGHALMGRDFTAAELADLCGGIEDDGSLRRTLEQAGCSDPDNARAVGYWLRDCRDRQAAGWMLQSAGKRKIGVQWRFVQKIASFAGHDLV